MHHIVSDAWSIGVLYRELGALYRAFTGGTAPALPELPIQYADFASWQRDELRGERSERLLAYWRDRLRGAPPLLALPSDRPRPPVQRHEGGLVSCRLPHELAQALDELSRAHGCTLFMTLLAGFYVLLQRHSGQSDLVVGTPIANRTRSELEGLIGFFDNTLALRTDLSGDPTLGELLARVRETALGAYQYQDLPLEKLVEELNPPRSLASAPLFQLLFSLSNTPHRRLTLEGAQVGPLPPRAGTAKFDQSWIWEVTDGEVQGYVEYDSDLFDPATIERMVAQYRRLLETMVARPAARISALELHAPRRPSRPAVSPPPVHQLFAAQAARTPEVVAVEMGESRVSYRQLDERSDRLAHRLVALGVGPETRVGICADRSIEMVVGVLAILKAGGAFVPLDPDYPAERLLYMLEHSGAQVVLAHERHRALLAGYRGAIEWLSAVQPDESPSRAPLPPRSHAESACYVIYTSGSTGRPKGVVVPHRVLATLCTWHNRTLLAGVRVLQLASLSFDASSHELFAALSSGGTVVLLSEDERREVPRLLALMAERRIEKAIVSASLLRQLAEHAEDRLPDLSRLRELIATAEPLQITARVRELFAALPHCRLANHYGPTETHVATAVTLPPEVARWPALPSIGQPIDGTQVHLLDRHGDPVPVGLPGELYLGGACVARGYLDQPGLTAARFVPDPFAGVPGARMYRTGDLARELPDGSIAFLGRNDDQLKVRGFRVEPGEIEVALARVSGVQAAAVIALADANGDNSLVAYVVSGPGFSTDGLRRELRAHLPDYLIPSRVVRLDALPVTPSGKVDRRALPAPESAPDGVPFVAPRSPVEFGRVKIQFCHADSRP